MAIYQVNYTVSNSYTVYVEATSPEDASDIVEEIYQENFDALPEDGELDHDIDTGILIDEELAKSMMYSWERVLTREDTK
jgi:hypothetical protein